MPELPEVETVVRGLRKIICGRTISSVYKQAPQQSIVVSNTLLPKKFEDILRKKEILDIQRRGKNILIKLSGELTLWVHLKMTGHFTWVKSSTPIDKHDLVVFDFSPRNNSKASDEYHLRFNDYRRFGRLRLFPDNELWKQKGLADLGPEPLEISANEFVELFQRRPRQIKQAMLDQSFIAGIGNIYADETLYLSRIHPLRLTTSVSKNKLIELHTHIQTIMKNAIRLHGTSVDSYAGVNGKTGSFQKYLLAYGREGEPCNRCGKKIVRQKIGSRSAHFCPNCQKLGR